MHLFNGKNLVCAIAMALVTTPLLAASAAAGAKSAEAGTEPAAVVFTTKAPASCTATATVSIPGGSKIELSATAATCAEAIRMVRAAISKI
ncbi:hypothetical protein FY528_13955 [Hymenobacter lutimineralis]|uniref:Uncharacterized protein n=1 Tax=Hymenobacter lutimineralis TaxID=2606448 RepID=A0A5D6UW43_9BACT|nr:hypothetical protein [Hymenobacter lutimineralis]TYZ07796.1 hypothetical protein FY528_13955 [Hymenobacter lutimineralis]